MKIFPKFPSTKLGILGMWVGLFSIVSFSMAFSSFGIWSKKISKEYSFKIKIESNIDRNSFLYCLHSNKRSELFHKNIFYILKREAGLSRKVHKGMANRVIEDILKGERNERSEKIDSKSKECLSLIIESGLSKYFKLNVERIFRKHIPFDFAKFTWIKNEMNYIKKVIFEGKLEFDQIQEIFVVWKISST